MLIGTRRLPAAERLEEFSSLAEAFLKRIFVDVLQVGAGALGSSCHAVPVAPATP